MVATPYNKHANPVFLVNQSDGEPYMAGTEVGSSVEITGDALTALQSLVTLLTATNALLTTANTLSTAANVSLAAIDTNTDRIP